jgi:hypothetical protein
MSVKYRHCTWTLRALISALTVGCTGEHEVEPAEIHFAEVNRYGWSELADSTRSMTDVERRYAGGVLSNIAGIAESESGDLLVLDRDFQKIVVFTEDGSFKRIILGGYGEGPGEFSFPRHLALDAHGRIIVLDRGNRRVTLFDSAGTYLTTDPVGFEALQVVVSRDTAFLLDVPRDGRSAMRARRLGDHIGSAVSTLPPDSRMAHFAEHGEPGSLGVSASGYILYAHPSPGRWYDGDVAAWRGHELFPDVQGERIVEEDGFERRFISVGTRGISALPHGQTLISFTNVARPGTRLPDTTRAVIFDSEARLVAEGTLDDSLRVRHLLGSMRTNSVFAAYSEPYPHIRRFSITFARRVAGQ